MAHNTTSLIKNIIFCLEKILGNFLVSWGIFWYLRYIIGFLSIFEFMSKPIIPECQCQWDLVAVLGECQWYLPEFQWYLLGYQWDPRMPMGLEELIWILAENANGSSGQCILISCFLVAPTTNDISWGSLEDLVNLEVLLKILRILYYPTLSSDYVRSHILIK